MMQSKTDSARRIRKAIAFYLVVSILYTVAYFGISDSEFADNNSSIGLMAAFLGATIVGAVGLVLDRKWGYWTAVIVLFLQLIKVQFDGFTYDVVSLVSIYFYAGGSISIGISAASDPSFNISTGTSTPWWLGVNIIVALVFGNLLAAKKPDE